MKPLSFTVLQVADHRSQVEGCMSQAIVAGGGSRVAGHESRVARHRPLWRVTGLAFSVIPSLFIRTSW